MSDGPIESNDTTTNANVESDSGNAAFRADEVTTIPAPCCVTFTHTRKRLADPDGVSTKAVLDGFVQVGVLADDSAQQVTEVRHCQVKGRTEETEVLIEW